MPSEKFHEVSSQHLPIPPPPHARGLPEYLTLAAFASLIAFAIPFHEPWEDEAQAWQIAQNVSIPQLFQHSLRYEGTPGLWHLFLHILISLHIGYTAMHWITGGIATLGIALLVFYAPFPRLFRLTLPFTFFLAFQYAVVARSYVLVPVFLFATATVWKRSNPLPAALCLGLLANTASHAFALALGFPVIYFIELRRNLRPRPPRPQLLRAATVLFILWAIAVFSVLPPPADLSFAIPEWHEPLAQRILLWPIVGILPLFPVVLRPGWLAIIVCTVVTVQIARKHLLLYFLPLIPFALLCGHYCSPWHAGLLIPSLITSFWLVAESKSRPNDQPNPHPFDRSTIVIATIAIAIQIGWTIAAVRYDHYNPYSADLATARFLAPHVQAGETLAVTYERDPYANAFSVVGLYPYLPNLHFLDEPHTYWLWSRNEHTEAAFQQAMQQHPNLVLIESWQVTPASAPSLTGDHITFVRNRGYRYLATFCGRQTLGFRAAPDIRCHVIFQR